MKREQRNEVEKAETPRAEGDRSRNNEILLEETVAREFDQTGFFWSESCVSSYGPCA
jgi:hypothetical protein